MPRRVHGPAHASVTTSSADDAGIPAALVTGAKQRLSVVVGPHPDKTLVTQLVDASKRGVQVQMYMVAPAAGDARAKALCAQLEQLGLDIVVERSARIPV